MAKEKAQIETPVLPNYKFEFRIIPSVGPFNTVIIESFGESETSALEKAIKEAKDKFADSSRVEYTGFFKIINQ